jgi:hypothetical protein
VQDKGRKWGIYIYIYIHIDAFPYDPLQGKIGKWEERARKNNINIGA